MDPRTPHNPDATRRTPRQPHSRSNPDPSAPGPGGAAPPGDDRPGPASAGPPGHAARPKHDPPLPPDAAQPPAAAQNEQTEAPQRRRPAKRLRHILVADDEHLMAAGIASTLRAMDLSVVGPASHGEAAVELAREQPVDLAILDIRMPGIDGVQTAKRLWDERTIPTVIVSAFSDPGYVDRAAETGVFGYLIKPVGEANLRTALAVAWARAVESVEQNRRVRQLQASLDARRAVEQAKWQIVRATGLTEPDAHHLLQRLARNNRKRLADVAELVVRGDISTDHLRAFQQDGKLDPGVQP